MKIVVTGALGHIGSRLIREIPSTFHEAASGCLRPFVSLALAMIVYAPCSFASHKYSQCRQAYGS